jgi:hypothetical protein
VPDEAALEAFLRCIETVLACFKNELGGGFTTLRALDRRAQLSNSSH